MHGHTCKLFDNTIDSVQNKGNGEIQLDITTLKKLNLIVYKLKGLKDTFFLNPTTVFYQQIV